MTLQISVTPTTSGLAAAVLAALGLAACSPSPAHAPAPDQTAPPTVTAPTQTQAPPASSAADALVGRWTGPEGTALVIAANGAAYQVTVTNLDGPRDFTGAPDPAGVRFTRDGQPLLIRKGSGAETGMKWLADKTDCVVVAANEGYCRD